MKIRLHIENDYKDHIVSDIINRLYVTLVVSSNVNRMKTLLKDINKHNSQVFGKKYKIVTGVDHVDLKTPINKIYMITPTFTFDRVCGLRPNNIIVDDFTRVPHDFMEEVMYGIFSCGEPDCTFYTSDIKNEKIYSWINDYSDR